MTSWGGVASAAVVPGSPRVSSVFPVVDTVSQEVAGFCLCPQLLFLPHLPPACLPVPWSSPIPNFLLPASGLDTAQGALVFSTWKIIAGLIVWGLGLLQCWLGEAWCRITCLLCLLWSTYWEEMLVAFSWGLFLVCWVFERVEKVLNTTVVRWLHHTEFSAVFVKVLLNLSWLLFQ